MVEERAIQEDREQLEPAQWMDDTSVASTTIRKRLMAPDLPFSEALLNFRDVAEIPNPAIDETDQIVEGKVFRSAEIDDISDRDRELLLGQGNGRCGIKSVVDLRYGSVPEQEGAKHQNCRYPGEGRAPIFVNLTGTWFRLRLVARLVLRFQWFPLLRLIWFVLTGRKDPDAIWIIGRYAISPGGLDGMAIDTLKSSVNDFRKIFDLLAQPSSYPVHFYCQQGKDRTGLTVILLLLMLGIPMGIIQQDYQQSEHELEPIHVETEKEFAEKGMPPEFARCHKGLVQRVVLWLEANNTACEGRTGVDRYLTSIGVDKEKRNTIRQILLKTPDTHKLEPCLVATNGSRDTSTASLLDESG